MPLRPSLRTTRMEAVRTDVDSGGGAGTLEIGTAGFSTIIAVFDLDVPCGTVTGDTLTLSGMPKSTVGINGGGMAGEGRTKNSLGEIIRDGILAGPLGYGFPISLSSVNITDGGTVQLLSYTETHPS